MKNKGITIRIKKVGNNKGITLIALVITIIVLLLLAGITLNLVLGENGIITRAKEAKFKAELVEQEEQDRLLKLNIQMQLAQNEVPEEWKQSVAEIREQSVPIPKGFEYLEGSKSIGLVIRDTENQNEFVWVPIEIGSEDSSKQVSNLKGWYTAKDDQVNTEEYKALVASIYKYGGFYVARYEATYLEGTGTDGDVSGTDSATLSSYKASSVPAKRIATEEYTKQVGDLWNNITYQGAFWASKNMYLDSDSVKSNLLYGTQWDSILHWIQETDGLKNTEIDSDQTTEWKITTDSKSWGTYYNSTFQYVDPITKTEKTKQENLSELIPTGSSQYTKANNIYDLAGNTFEWTQEKGDIGHYRRGGNYLIRGDAYPASKFLVSYDDSRFSYLSFRRRSLYSISKNNYPY